MAIKLGQGLKRDSGTDVPNVAAPNDPGVQIRGDVEGRQGFQQLERTGSQIQDFAAQKFREQQAQQLRIQSRHDKIQEVRGARSFNDSVLKHTTELRDTDDISLPETQEKYRVGLQQESARVLSEFKGSDIGRTDLQLRLENDMNTALDEFAIAGEKEQRRILGEHIDSDIKAQVDIVQTDPTRIEEALQNIEAIMEDNANVLQPEQEDAFHDDGRRDVYKAALDTHIFSNSIDTAIDLINDPAARRALGPEKVQDYRNRIKKFEEAKDSEDPSFTEQINEINDLLPSDKQLNPEEIKTKAGAFIAPAKKSKIQQLIEGARQLTDAGINIPDEQLTSAVKKAIGIEPTAAELGQAEAEQEIAKTAALKKAGELPAGAGDLIDETGVLKNEVSNSISARVAEAMGGSFNPETGKATLLTPEQSELLPQLASEAGKLVLQGKVKDLNEAVAITMAGKDIPRPKTFEATANELIQAIETPTDESIASDAANFDKIDLNNATGAGSAFVEFYGKVMGQISNEWIDTKNREDRNRLKMLAHEFILANKRSDRLPVFEQRRLEAIFSGPGVIESGESTRAVFRSLDDQLTEDITIKKKMLAIDGIPAKEKSELLMDVLTMSRFQKKLRTFDMTPGGSDNIEFESAEDIAGSSDQDFNKFMRNQTEDSLNALPDDVFEAIKERANGESSEEPAEETFELNEAQKARISEMNMEELQAMLKEAKSIPERKNFVKVFEDAIENFSEEDKKKSRKFGLRTDGTEKDIGFLGLLKRPDGKVSSEISVSVEVDGKELLIPTLVPTLTQKEIDFLLNMKEGDAEEIPEPIMKKSVDHALKRIEEGKDPFFKTGEKE